MKMYNPLFLFDQASLLFFVFLAAKNVFLSKSGASENVLALMA
ncbi:hypothetical protein [Dickeya zeae]|nr:hypothetical protein [Dickeya zeae]